MEESYGHFVRHFGQAGRLLLARASTPTSGSWRCSTGWASSTTAMRIGGEPRRAMADGQPLRPLDHPGDALRPADDSVPGVSRRPGHARSRRCSRQLDQHLDEHESVVLYGHPCYEGVREAVLRKVFARVLERGFRFVTMQTMAERLQAVAPAR